MKTKKLIITVLSIAVVALIVIAIVLAMNGTTKTTGNSPEDIKGESLACESHSIKYPIFEYDEAKSRDLEITMNFYDKKFSAISLAYTLYYDSEEKINASEAHNHASMNISFGKNGLKADAYDANYSKLSDSMKMILYVNEKDFNTTAAKYFMIDVENEKSLPDTINEFRKIYKSQGFSCSIN